MLPHILFFKLLEFMPASARAPHVSIKICHFTFFLFFCTSVLSTLSFEINGAYSPALKAACAVFSESPLVNPFYVNSPLVD